MSIKFTFRWNGYLKPVTTMLIGTSPELEIALYTLCYRTRPNQDCYVSLAGTRFKIVTVTTKMGGLRSAYFEM